MKKSLSVVTLSAMLITFASTGYAFGSSDITDRYQKPAPAVTVQSEQAKDQKINCIQQPKPGDTVNPNQVQCQRP